MRLLLINPRFPESFWSYKWAIDNVVPGARTVNPPLGLATRDFVVRNFSHALEHERRLAERYLHRIRDSLHRYLYQGSLVVTLDKKENSHSQFLLSLSGKLGREFFVQAADQLEHMLRETKSSVTLHIEECHVAELELLREMLERLKRYGDRIVIAADQRVRSILDLDSSVFHVTMTAN